MVSGVSITVMHLQYLGDFIVTAAVAFVVVMLAGMFALPPERLPRPTAPLWGPRYSPRSLSPVLIALHRAVNERVARYTREHFMATWTLQFFWHLFGGAKFMAKTLFKRFMPLCSSDRKSVLGKTLARAIADNPVGTQFGCEYDTATLTCRRDCLHVFHYTGAI
jgi:hypothetical protein